MGTATTTGWVIFVASIGMMFGMLAVDVAALKEWGEMTTPTFIGSTLGHIASIIAAFLGGKLIPNPEDRAGMYTRHSDEGDHH